MSTAGGLPLGLAIVWLCTMSHASRSAGGAATAGASWNPVSLWSRAVPNGPTAAAARDVRKDNRVEPTESPLSHSNDSRGRRCVSALSGVAYARARLPCMRGRMCMRLITLACLRVYVSTFVRASMFLYAACLRACMGALCACWRVNILAAGSECLALPVTALLHTQVARRRRVGTFLPRRHVERSSRRSDTYARDSA
jgi:hypothetical protein